MKLISHDYRRWGVRECDGILAGCVVAVFVLVHAVAMTCIARDGADRNDFVSDEVAGMPDEVPKILLLEFSGSRKYDPGLHEALLAQLSAAPVAIGRADVTETMNFESDPSGNAARLAEQYDAAMVFWIEDAEVCRLYFYIPDSDGGRMNSRRLNLSRNSSWSRTQIIAIAAASMVDGLLVTHRIMPEPEKKEAPPPEREVQVREPDAETKKFEFTAGYAGDVFATDQFRHGVLGGLGGFVTKHVILSAAFIWYVPTTFRTDEFELTLQSRIVEVGMTARWELAPMELRLGTVWQFDLRSVAVESRVSDFVPEPEDFRAVSAVLPYIAAIWNLNHSVSIMGRIGAEFVLNDTVYKIQRGEGDTVEFTPHHVRLSYILGLIIRM